MVDANQHNKKSDIIKIETIGKESNDSTSGNNLDQSTDDSVNAVQSIDEANFETVPKDLANIQNKKYLIYDIDQSNGSIDAKQTESGFNANSQNIIGDGLIKLTEENLIQPNLVDDEKNHLSNYFDKKIASKPKYRKANHHQRLSKRYENELMIQSEPEKDKSLVVSKLDPETNESTGKLSFTQRLIRYSMPFYFLFFLLFLIFLLIPFSEDDFNCLRRRTQYAFNLQKLFTYGPPPI